MQNYSKLDPIFQRNFLAIKNLTKFTCILFQRFAIDFEGRPRIFFERNFNDTRDVDAAVGIAVLVRHCGAYRRPWSLRVRFVFGRGLDVGDGDR